MTDYGPTKIVGNAAHFSGGWLTNPIYSIKRCGGQVVCKRTACGSFDTADDASKAGTAAACRWVNEH